MSYNTELQSNNADLQEILKQVNALPNANTSGGADMDEILEVVESKYGVVFDAFPSEAQIKSLPNKSYFSVRGHGVSGEQNEVVNYYITTDWRSNALQYEADSGSTIYVVPVNQMVGEIYLPYYGIKAGAQNAVSNSEIMAKLIPNVAYGSTFRFPVGHFYFSEPIDVSGKQASIVGASTDGFKSSNKIGTTYLHFTDLAEGETALTVAQCCVSDFTIMGNPEQYSLDLVRDNAFTDINTVVQETVGVKAYGIKATGCMIIRDVGFCNFYYGCWCGDVSGGNMFITNTTFQECHHGLTINHDNKVMNIFGVKVMTLLNVRGSLNSAIGVRGDSIGNHLVQFNGGWGYVLTDLDADFCMNAIIGIGDGETAGSVSDLVVNGVRGRSGVSHFYPDENPEITANDITADNAEEFGVVAIKAGSALNGATITTNQNGRNPFDNTPGYKVPFILLSAGAATTVKGVQFLSTSANGDELTADWVKKRIASCSVLADACDVKVQTSKGFINYTKTNGVVTVIDDATDIYRRMDKSAFAMNGEVVKTVNGVQPDDDGNVEVVEQEPEVVKSSDEFVDTSKKYVLPDGYIYAYRKKFIPGATTPNFTNQLPISLDPSNKNEILNGVGYKEGTKYIYDWGTGLISEGTPGVEAYTTGLIPVKTGDVIRINAMGYHTTSGDDIFSVFIENYGVSGLKGNDLSKITDGGGKYTSTGVYGNGLLSDVEIHVNNATFGWMVDDSYIKTYYMPILITNTTPPEDVVITVNEEITYTITEDRYEWSWENTGELYVKPDYLGMIAELEARIVALESAIS